jgi:hypothetical protein
MVIGKIQKSFLSIVTIGLLSSMMVGCGSDDTEIINPSGGDVIVNTPADGGTTPTDSNSTDDNTISGTSTSGSTATPAGPTITPPTSADTVKITTENADNIIASTLGGISEITDSLANLPVISPGDVPIVGITQDEKEFAGLVATLDVAPGTLGMELSNTLGICTEGGTVDVTTKTDDVATFVFDNCKDKGRVANGTAELTKLEEPAYSLALTKFTYDTTFIDGGGLYYNSMDFDIKILQGYSHLEGDKIQVLDLAIAQNAQNLSAHSWIKNDCMGTQWVHITTVKPMVIAGTACPTDGQYKIEGNDSEIIITFNQDQSVDTTINGETGEHYATCNELPTYNQECR